MTAVPPAIFLMGATATGKTNLAVNLVTRYPLEIISVDSAQIYRHMDIGTAKPTADILQTAPHRLINIRNPDQTYSAAEFRADAVNAMHEITAQGRIPLLVGGTGLYFRAIRYGLSELPSADPKLRMQLIQEAQERGWQALHKDLARIDPITAARIHPHDTQRIQRALEVCYLTHRPLSVQQRGRNLTALPYRVLILALAPRHRDILRSRITTRFNHMLKLGLDNEVRQLLLNWKLSPTNPAMRCVGYRQMFQHIQGMINWNEMVEKSIIATAGLAKRQLTWLRAEPNVTWLYDEDGDPVLRSIELVGKWLM
jgi:tRNA dimethylallyltransferase